MRLLTFILSLYLIALSTIPCVDAGSDEPSAKKEVSHNEKDSHNDLCSPFCVCACCGLSVLNYTPISTFEIKSEVITIVKAESHYKSAFISNYRQSIWQPPQLA